ncbi:hypothetical protein TMatcc_008656 [Talaromyces marneffei ATCC 18224]
MPHVKLGPARPTKSAVRLRRFSFGRRRARFSDSSLGLRTASSLSLGKGPCAFIPFRLASHLFLIALPSDLRALDDHVLPATSLTIL